MIFEQRKELSNLAQEKTYIQLIIEEKGKNASTEWKKERQRKIRMKEKKKGKSKILD